MRFARKWGQNFLADREQLDRLVGALELAPGDRVIEIGPGLGVLTRELAMRAADVAAVEIDPACVRALALTLRGSGNVRVIKGDILTVKLADLMLAPYRVVGNIPYNLTGALFVHLLEQGSPAARIDLLVQREVADRLAAPPGGWGLATLAVRIYGRPEVLLTIPKEAFFPQPKVASALLRIIPEPTPALPRSEQAAFFDFVRRFFQARRKQLPYVLSRGLGVGTAEARDRLRAAGIDPARRPQTLALDEWRNLFKSEGANFKGRGSL